MTTANPPAHVDVPLLSTRALPPPLSSTSHQQAPVRKLSDKPEGLALFGAGLPPVAQAREPEESPPVVPAPDLADEIEEGEEVEEAEKKKGGFGSLFRNFKFKRRSTASKPLFRSKEAAPDVPAAAEPATEEIPNEPIPDGDGEVIGGGDEVAEVIPQE